MNHRAFVSSTFEDLKTHRAHVIKELRRAGIQVDPMEDWTASTEEPKQFSRQRVNGCDLCVLLVGFRRGFVPDGETLSITQMEYEAAAKDLDVLVFMAKEDVPWPPQFYELEKDPLLKQWRGALKKSHGTEFFDWNAESIDVAPAISRWLQERGADSQRAALAAVPEWEPSKLTALVKRWTNDFAVQMSAGDEANANEASSRYLDLYVADRSAGAQSSLRPLADLVATLGTRSLVYGEGGSGKSTALLKQAVDLAIRAQTEPDAPIPLYVRLNLFDRTEDGFDRLLEMVSDTVGLAGEDLRQLWRVGKRPLLFLLDGYNEVAVDCQAACAKALQELAQGPRHGIVVTSRPTTVLDSLLGSGFKAVDVVHLNDEQIRDFLDRYGARELYDQLGEPLKELGRNPFMLWALAQSRVGTGKGELPRNKGELYRSFVDHYLFEQREARKLPAPTRFHYERVKKPVLAALALEMCRAGLTRLPEDVTTLKTVRDQLKRIRAEYEELLDVKPHVLMPESAKATQFVDEVVTNSVMRRTANALEFMHQSIRDYFGAVALLKETPESILAEVPTASWVRPEKISTLTNERRSNLHEAIVICSGLMSESDGLVTGLAPRDPLLAAECLAAGTVSEPSKAAFTETCLALLQATDVDSRFVGCACVRACRIATEPVMRQLETILFSEEEWSATRREAIRAIGESGSDSVVPTLLRLIGTTLDGTLVLEAVLAITTRIYGRPDYALGTGLLMWHFIDSGSPLEQRIGLKWRQGLYKLYLAGRTPEELVDVGLGLDLGWVNAMTGLALLRLLHQATAVKRFLQIIQERSARYKVATLFLPQVGVTEEIAGELRRVLENRETSMSDKIDASAGLACIALQQDHELSKSFCRISISWRVRDLLVDRAYDRSLPAHDRVAAAVGLAKSAEHVYLRTLLGRVRDPTQDKGVRVLICSLEPMNLWEMRTHWLQVYEFADKGDRTQEFAEAQLQIALEEEDDFLRSLAVVRISQNPEEWVLRKVLERIGDHKASLRSRQAAVQALGSLRNDEALAKLVELIRNVGESKALIGTAIRALAESADGEKALEQLDELIKAAPHSADLHRGRSQCLAAMDRKEKALEDALLAVDLSPNDAQLHAHLAGIRALMQQNQEAINSYRRALALDPDCSEAHWGLAAASYALSDKAEALASARRAEKLGPQLAGNFFNLGWYAYTCGAFEESIAASRRAAQLDPTESMPLFNLGLALLSMGNTVEAAKWYEAGIDRCFAFPQSALAISGALDDLDTLAAARTDLLGVAKDVQKRLRECQVRLGGGTV